MPIVSRWIVALLVLAVASPAAAETFRIGYGEAKKVKGVTVRVEVRGHSHFEDGGAEGDYALVLTKGKKTVEERMSGEVALIEVVGFGLQVVARGGLNDVEITVNKAGKVKKGKLGSQAAMDRVVAEGKKRKIGSDGAGASAQGGIIRVWLTDGRHQVVSAAIGERSRKLLWFDVDAYARIAPTRRKGAKVITLAMDSPDFWKVGGIRIEYEGSTWILRKGKKELRIERKTWFETVAFGKLVQVAVGELAISSTKGLKKTDASAAQAKVEKEAKRRGIRYDKADLSYGDGIHIVMLDDGKEWVVTGVVGERSGDLLAFDVFRPGEGGKPREEPDDAAPPSDAQPDSIAQALLDAHNGYRGKHCAADLKWSDELAKVAQAWADQLRDGGCSFEHSRTKYGENLAAGTAGSLTPEEVVAMWYDEIADYDFGAGGFSMETGHLTQVIWKRTTHLGCGKTTCGGMDLWVCNYNPPGNVDGEYKKNVLAKNCTK